jgi:hypothetical protein
MPASDHSADLAERIDRSIGVAPESALAVDTLLSRGRLSRRRRRAAAGGAATAVLVAVVATLAVGAAERPGHVRGTRDFASSQSPTATAGPTGAPTPAPSPAGSIPEAEREQLKSLADRAVTFRGDGHISLPPGASVVRSLPNPYGMTAPAWSRGLAVDFHGHEFWYAMTGSGDGSVTGGTQYVVLPQDGDAAFARFVADQDPGRAATSSVGPDVWPDVTSVEPVHLTFGSKLVAEAGFQVVSQRAGVDVGRAWAGPGDQTAAALVRADDGSTYYVLARRLGSKPAQYVTVPTAGNGADLTAFLGVATARYASAARSR